MINDELLNKFARIKDLPVSEEMLGAYLEDNLSSIEILNIDSSIEEHSYLRDIIDSNINGSYHQQIEMPYDLISFEIPVLATIQYDEYIDINLPTTSLIDNIEDSPMIAACAMDDADLIGIDNTMVTSEESFGEDEIIDSLENNIDTEYE